MICPYCVEPILDHEPVGEVLSSNALLFFHFECRFRMMVGSAAHLLHECPCYGGQREDPPGMSRRAAAQLSLDTYEMVKSAYV